MANENVNPGGAANKSIKTNVKPPAKKEKKPKKKDLVDIDEPKRKRHSPIFGLTVFLIFFVILTGATASYIFNWFGFRNMVIEFFVTQDDKYKTMVSQLEGQKQVLVDYHAQLEKIAAQLTIDSQTIDASNDALNARQEAVDSKEKEINDFNSSLQMAEFDLDKIIKLYEGMDAKKAAAAMTKIANKDTVGNILLRMDIKKASAIMSNFDPLLTAQITARLMQLKGEI